MNVSAFSAGLLRPGDAAYEAARSLHNGLIDKHPAAIARCESAGDVVNALALARSEGLVVTVRAGGHNVAGKAMHDGGLVVDVRPMARIEIDSAERRARVGAGATWAEFNATAQLHGLATTGGVVSSTGVAGLTLGGGFGWLMGKYGLAIDNLLELEVVLADGNIVSARADSHPDLFWALRGGGGSLGVVTRLDFRLHPVGPTVIGGLVAHPIGAAREVLQFFREYSSSAPDDLTMAAALTYAPDGSGTPIVALLMCHCGPVAAGEAHAARIREFGSPVVNALGPIAYSDLNRMLDAGFPRGARNYWKSRMIDTLSDEFIDRAIDSFARSTSPLDFIILERIHGAAARPRAEATAFPHRGEGFSLLVISQWLEPARDADGRRWAQQTYQTLETGKHPTAYVNYLSADDLARPATSFGENAARLLEIRRRYDPQGLFVTWW